MIWIALGELLVIIVLVLLLVGAVQFSIEQDRLLEQLEEQLAHMATTTPESESATDYIRRMNARRGIYTVN